MRKLFHGTVLKGKLILTEQSAYNTVLRSLESKEIELSIGTIIRHRSNNQNRYYWAVVLRLIGDYTGYHPEEAHDAMRLMFLLDREKKIPTLRSTTDLTTVEFEEYLARIRQFAAADLSVFIPLPNEVDF